MSVRGQSRYWAVVMVCFLTLSHAPAVLACAACFGKSDSAMARGMNMGIFSLLVVVVCVLASVAGFFVFLARRGAKAAAAMEPRQVLEPTTRS